MMCATNIFYMTIMFEYNSRVRAHVCVVRLIRRVEEVDLDKKVYTLDRRYINICIVRVNQYAVLSISMYARS